jgi:glutathione S-transferase
VPTLYDADRCPYCARVRIALAEKLVPHQVVEVDLANRPDWLYDKNPLGKVPVLEKDEWVLPESLVILEYLEERYPAPALLPADPADRAEVRYRIHRFDAAVAKPYYALRRGQDGAEAALERALAELDAEQAAWAHPFGLADIVYVPWLLRIRDMLGVDLGPYPALAEWVERLSERSSVAAEAALVAALQPA